MSWSRVPRARAILPADDKAARPLPMHPVYASSECRACGRQRRSSESATRAESRTERRGVVGDDASVSSIAVAAAASCLCCDSAAEGSSSNASTAATMLACRDGILLIGAVLTLVTPDSTGCAKVFAALTACPPRPQIERPPHHTKGFRIAPLSTERGLDFH